MRTKIDIARRESGYTVRLTDRQRATIRAVLLFIRDHGGPEAVILQLGCSVEVLETLNQRLGDGGPRDWSIEEIHSIYSALGAIGNLFSSEEEFYIRLGFFRENSIAMALSLLESLMRSETGSLTRADPDRSLGDSG
ncbi:hypothetical protein I6A60_10525 [Frankia sp. AgB1.9]|uniref:hypothetical protein n=1 Tax=unclassified Frankia TaxID=2632575 RepID=UPI00193237CC|nr:MULTISPECIES: hypothetical protein [unclassified Frankia]MBL7488081.1 hypothetical protein [Frankia sp. AgW1.1]MBL7548308.1 hypothetical protein [Frankia sp. AgB1.9]MBL7625221.1 hypothetical protein [Frankia sp. AgB1.8]